MARGDTKLVVSISRSHHPLGLDSDGDRTPVGDVDGHDGRLVQDDPLAARIDQGVRGAEIDREVTAQCKRIGSRHVNPASSSDSNGARKMSVP